MRRMPPTLPRNPPQKKTFSTPRRVRPKSRELYRHCSGLDLIAAAVRAPARDSSPRAGASFIRSFRGGRAEGGEGASGTAGPKGPRPSQSPGQGPRPARRGRRFSTGPGQRPLPPRPRRSRRPLAAAPPSRRCSPRLVRAGRHSAERGAGPAPGRAPLLCKAAPHWLPGLPRAGAIGQRRAPVTRPPEGPVHG